MADVCGFCGSEGVNKEHIWPDWLRKVTLESRGATGQKRFKAEIERDNVTKEFQSSGLQMTVRMPCEKCNSGWMSSLEGGVKDWMTPMVYRGEKVLLERDQQLALARWALKTAMVYEFISPNEPMYFTESERKAFKERFEIPENVWIWAGRYDGPRPMHAVQRRSPKDALAFTLFSVTFCANFFAFQVFAYRSSVGDLSRYPVGTTRERLHQIWPAPQCDVWPPETTIDDEALAVLDDRFVNVLKQA